MPFFIYPYFLFVGLCMGAMQLITPFGLLYALPVFGLIVASVIFGERKKKELSGKLIFSAGLGQLLLFLSWVVSRVSLNEADAVYRWGSDTPSREIAGFPIRALEIPGGAMGGDIIPLGMWPGVFVNVLFWFIVAFVMSSLIAKRKKSFLKNRYVERISLVVGILFLLYNLAMFLIWYD